MLSRSGCWPGILFQIGRHPVKVAPPVSSRRYAGPGTPESSLSPLTNRKTTPARPSKLPVVSVYNPKQSLTPGDKLQRKMTPPSSDETSFISPTWSKPSRTGPRVTSRSPSRGPARRGDIASPTFTSRRRSPSVTRSVSMRTSWTGLSIMRW